jgi:thymidylate synthase (FAD)
MKNKIELLEYFGSDLMVTNVARVSYGKFKDDFDDKDKKLIKYLVEHKHTSPFRHSQLQFRVKCPIYVERQIFKHQVGISTNSISGRYVDFSDSYDIPNQLRYQSKDSKQGSSGDLEIEENSYFVQKMNDLVKSAKELYSEMESAGIAKEQCRAILPLCLETTFIWTGSLLAFIHLCNLRIKPDTQKETRLVVEQMLELVKNIEGEPFKHTIKAFGL